jgi:uncharacterized protein
MQRRIFLQTGIAGIGLFTGIYAHQIEPFWLEFVKKKMPVRNLPEGLIGKTLMQISDMHVGNRFDWQFIINSFKEAQRFEPDFVVYTGDFVSYDSAEQLTQLKEVMKHTVLGKIGTVGILGNHDYGKNWQQTEVADQITDILKQAQINVLRNEQKEINELNFIGLDDYWATNFNPQRALSNYDAQKANIVLCHNPDVCDLNVWNGYQGWILSGHTHGGQCKPPFLNAPLLPVKNKKYAQGEVDLKDGRTMYINRALGHLWQIRLNVRPEITIFELKKG